MEWLIEKQTIDNLFYDEEIKEYLKKNKLSKEEHYSDFRTDILLFNPKRDRIVGKFENTSDALWNHLIFDNMGNVPLTVTELSRNTLVFAFSSLGQSFDIIKRLEYFGTAWYGEETNGTNWSAMFLMDPIQYEFAQMHYDMINGEKKYIIQEFFGKDDSGKYFKGFISV